jgi:hypothetical protein
VKNTLPVPITEINAGTSRFWMHRPQGVVADAVSLIWASAGVAAFREERIIPDGAGVLLFNFGDAARKKPYAGCLGPQHVCWVTDTDTKKQNARPLQPGVFTHPLFNPNQI